MDESIAKTSIRDILSNKVVSDFSVDNLNKSMEKLKEMCNENKPYNPELHQAKSFIMPNNILILSVPDGDWEGLYVNGKKVDENHAIRICDLVQYCPIGNIEEKCLDKFDPDEDSLPDEF